MISALDRFVRTGGAFALFILAAFYEAPIQAEAEPRYSEAIIVYQCGFESDDDRNYDDWPDGWKRARGPRYPHYLTMEIADHDPHEGEGCLHMKLDGGSAALFAPPTPVSSLFSYFLEARVRTQGLEHHQVFLRIQFFDADDQLLETHESSRLRKAAEWTQVQVGPISLQGSKSAGRSISDTSGEPSRVHYAIVSLHLESGEREDLDGSAWFDEVRLAQLPRMTLRSDVAHNVYDAFGDVAFTCEVSGITAPQPRMQFELLDIAGRVLRKEELMIEGTAIRYEELQREHSLQDLDESAFRQAFAGSITWKPFETGSLPAGAGSDSPAAQTLPPNAQGDERVGKSPAGFKYGYYRVRVAVEGDAGTMLVRTAPLAVVAPLSLDGHGEFGWSLPQGQNPLPLKPLLELLDNAAINWVKFPIWFSEHDAELADELAWFAERLTGRGIQLVGVLDQPPASQRELFGEEKHPLPVAMIFVERELWGKLLSPILTRLSLEVAWWQLGSDEDNSFVGSPNLNTKIAEIKSHLERFGQTAQIGFNWKWMHEPPSATEAPWAFLCQSVDPSFTADELERYLKADTKAGSRQWVVLRPLPSNRYRLETRAKDLVARMLVAKKHDVSGIFLSDPFDPVTGVMTPGGHPSELFVPWRTTASVINNTRFVGSLELPQKSRNMVFEKGDQAVLAVWNERPVEEVLYLGDQVQQIDLWGTSQSVAETREGNQERQVISVGPLPTFVTGLNLSVAKWRLGCQFDREQLSSTFGREQIASLRFRNQFPQGVSGQLDLETPEVWSIEPQASQFRLSAGEDLDQPLRVVLRSDASSGSQPLRIDFDVQADRNYVFSVYRTMQVGLGDVEIELLTRFDKDGNLVVEQTLTNNSEEVVSFNCLLFSSIRRRERKQVLNVGRGQVTDSYLLPNGRELIGQTLWLRAEEIGSGGRILNYHVKVQP